MKRIYKIIPLFIALFVGVMPLSAHAFGIVLDDEGQPVVGANVWWMNTSVGTMTGVDGTFELEPVKTTHKLITGYVGYRNDTTEVSSHEALTIVLVNAKILDEITISARKMSVLRSRTAAIDVQTITGDELCKAACCNLSESFETSASVDVAYADAATGAKQIRLLGLNGTYVQMLTENTPAMRGLAQAFGMEWVPGSWMQAIQVSKGTSSVVNGYEALTGQINVDYLQTDKADPLALNAMISKDLNAELNITGGWNVNDHAATALMLHAQGNFMGMDDNKDGFKDMPTGYNLNVLNRWMVHHGIWHSKILFRGLYDQRIGGQTSEAQALSGTPYVIDLRARRVEGIWKNGIHLNEEKEQTLGLIAAVSYHDQTDLYGSNAWDASQINAYFNGIFQTTFDDSSIDPEDKHEHTLAAGISVNYDRFNEGIFGNDLSRQEVTPGAFAEYTYSYLDKVTLLVGLREDYSTRYGAFTTPRMNVRYSPFPWWVMRASVGLGYRSPNLIADNAGLLASNRTWNIPAGNMLAQEKSMNTGGTMTFYIPLGKHEMSLSGEYYYTRFLDGVITDIDRSTKDVWLYNIHDLPTAQSFAHNLQVEANAEVLNGWTWTLAFRYTDVRQTTYSCATITPANLESALVLQEKPLQNRFKGIISTSYQTPKKTWQFDLTAQFNGPGRMPKGFVAPEGSKQYNDVNGVLYHTWYPQLLGQITKYFPHSSIYLGAENMTNFTQDSPILGARDGRGYVDPTSADYDASCVWAPIHGWKLYLGFRWSLTRDDDHDHDHDHDHHDHHER